MGRSIVSVKCDETECVGQEIICWGTQMLWQGGRYMLISTYHCIVPMHVEEELDFPHMVCGSNPYKLIRSLKQECSSAKVRAWCI